MPMRFFDGTEWNNRILANPDKGNIFQGYEFAQQKILTGWTPRFLGNDTIAITALEKTILGFGKLWYIPKGPGVSSVRQLERLLPDLQKISEENRVFAVKIEPELIKGDETRADLMKLGIVRTAPVQPNFSTVLLDLSSDLDTIMKNLNQKGRHAIRRAERDGVRVERVEADEENCKIMYDLLAATAANSFRIRSYSYYKSFWQRYMAAGYGQLFFAYVENKVVAGAFALVFGKKGTYKDGASVRERTVYGASHLLQWHVIRWVKEKGGVVHDLCGAPPSDQINNRDHPHYGIGRFKTSFNKKVVDYVGAYDMVIRPIRYKVWRSFGERLVMRLYDARLHESWY